MKHKTVAVFLIVGLALFLTSISPVNAADIVVSGNEVITIDSDYTQTGNILIQDSGTLIVKNSATLTTSGYDITVKGHGTLKIENGVLKANKMSLHDDAALEMTKNSKLELNEFLAKDRTNIALKNAEITTNGVDAACENIELSSAKIIGSSKVSIDVQSVSISDSTVKGSSISIKSASEISISDSSMITNNGENHLSDEWGSGGSPFLSITSGSNLLISNSKLSSGNGGDVRYGKGGTSSLSITSESILSILNSKVNSGNGGSGISLMIGDAGSSYLSITSGSLLSISNSEISSGNGGSARNGDGGSSSLSITSKSNLSVSNSKISSGKGGYGGGRVVWGLHVSYHDGGSSSLSITSKSDISIYRSKISTSYAGGTYRGEKGSSSVFIKSELTTLISDSEINNNRLSSSLSITSPLLNATNTIFNKPLRFQGNEAHLISVNASSINAGVSTTVYKYHWITANVKDKLGMPVENAKVDILHYLNESIYKSAVTDSNGIAKILVLTNIITSKGDEFVGNYKVTAQYQNYTTPKQGLEIKNNKYISLNFPELAQPSSIIHYLIIIVLSILGIIALIAAAIFIILWLRKHKPPADKDKLEILAPIKSAPSTVTPVYNIEEVGKYAECPYCGLNIRETFYEHGGIVRCNKCGAFHHKECFEYYGRKCGSPSCKLKDA